MINRKKNACFICVVLMIVAGLVFAGLLNYETKFTVIYLNNYYLYGRSANRTDFR
jgi:hypothetical protein